MTVSLSKEELITITAGKSVATSSNKISATAAEYDSREIKGGELFVALKGEATHGHLFLKQAYERGAALFLIESEEIAKDFPEPERVVLVDDTLKAFWKIANWWRHKRNVPILAITGSVGKTTVKEITASILLQASTGSFSLKSYNNHVGVPYSLCRIGTEHQWAVLEMGMNHAGEIRELSRIAEPDVGVISTIGPAHIENLGSIEAIIDAKLEITEKLKRVLIVNAEDQELCKRSQTVTQKQKLTLKYFARKDHSTVASLDASVSEIHSKGFEGVSFNLQLGNECRPVKMSVVGAQNALNAAAAALASRELLPDLSIEKIVQGLELFTAPLMRLSVKDLTQGRRVVDDSYNANPVSVSALLDLAAEFQGQGARVGLILGDMRELGNNAELYHRQIGQKIAALKPAFLVVVGPLANYFAEEAEKQGVQCLRAESPELAALVALKINFDILMVKASRAVKLEKTVATLLQREGI